MSRNRLTRKEKIRALLACGECETVAEAKIYLVDMGED